MTVPAVVVPFPLSLPDRIRVALASDQAVVRGALRALLEREPDIAMAGEAPDGAEAVEIARNEQPDVILMDISMPQLDGLEATRQITADPRLTDIRVIVLSTFGDGEHVIEALRSGARGFLGKDAEPHDLVHAIRVVAAGGTMLLPGLTPSLVANLIARTTFDHPLPLELQWLTRREREVVALVAAGLTNDQIADRLVLSRATAKTHVSRAMRKLQAHDRSQLVVAAYETGLVAPGHVVGPNTQTHADLVHEGQLGTAPPTRMARRLPNSAVIANRRRDGRAARAD
jgi:DNA-binding NarL/FixJ family response regulator